MGVLLHLEGQSTHQIYSFMWADNFWFMSQPKSHFEQMLKDLIQEALNCIWNQMEKKELMIDTETESQLRF